MLQPVARAQTEIATWEQALQYLRSRSVDLRVAALEVTRAEAQSRIALSNLLPTINGTATYTHNLITNDTLQPVSVNPPLFKSVSSPFPDYLTGSVLLTQPVIHPREWYAMGTASRGERVAQLTLEDTKRTIALSTANAIVAVVTAERVAELNRVGLFNALTRLELAVRKTALGSGTGLDVVRAKQDVETARATLVAGDETLRQARESLGIALGVPEQVGVSPNADLNGLEASARSTCKQAPTVDSRADIAALREKIDVAHRGVNDVKYQFSPTIDFRSSLATTTVDTGSSPATTWNVQAVLTVPIWDGGQKYGNLRDQSAQELEAVEKMEAAKRTATVQVTQARRAIGVAEDRRRVAMSARDLAAENDRLTRTSYLEGRGTSLELVTAAEQLRDAEIQLALREFDLVQARVGAVLALATCPW
jgi:outer membrane protein TolC